VLLTLPVQPPPVQFALDRPGLRRLPHRLLHFGQQLVGLVGGRNRGFRLPRYCWPNVSMDILAFKRLKGWVRGS
jgi:hypothetical protein